MKYIFIFSLALLFSCSNNKNLVKYSNIPKDLKPNSLKIDRMDVVYNKIIIENEDDLHDDITPSYSNVFKNLENIDPKTILISYINDNVLSKSLGNAGIRYEKTKRASDIKITKTEIKTLLFDNDDYIRDYYPEGGPIEGLDTDYALIIEELNVSRKNTYGVSIGLNNALPISGNGSTGILISIKYYIWDNINHKIITYKRLSEYKEATFNLLKRDWDIVTKNLANDFFKGTVIKLNSN